MDRAEISSLQPADASPRPAGGRASPDAELPPAGLALRNRLIARLQSAGYPMGLLPAPAGRGAGDGNVAAAAAAVLVAYKPGESAEPVCIFVDCAGPQCETGLALLRAIRDGRCEGMARDLPMALFAESVYAASVADAYRAGADWIIPTSLDEAQLDAVLGSIQRTLAARIAASMPVSAPKAASESPRTSESPLGDEQDMMVAQRVIEQLAGVESQPIAQVHTALAPMHRFSGDRLIAERTPSGVLHLFLADGIGHGLVPALLVLPLTRAFSTMSRKGFSLSAIVAELESTFRRYRLPGQFVAVTLAAYDPYTGCIEVWNGGNPGGLLLGPDGALLRRFPSNHLPLGLAEGAGFDSGTETVVAPDGAQLMLFSDGLVEAEAPDGSHYGEQRLLACAARHAPRRRVDAVLAEVKSHRGPAHDDISLVSLDCERQAPAVPAAAKAVAAKDAPASPSEGALGVTHGTRGGPEQWACRLRLDASVLRSVDTVPVIQNFLRDINPTGRDRSRQFVVLSELFNNALDHGLLRLESRLKEGPEGLGLYLGERARRLAALCEGEILIEAAGANANGQESLRLRIQDSGEGFEHAKMLDAAPAGEGAPLPHGRGIALVRRLADEFRFEGAGNVAEALCRLDDSAAGAAA